MVFVFLLYFLCKSIYNVYKFNKEFAGGKRMNIDISVNVRNTMVEAEKAIKRVPEVYRNELCKSLTDRFENPKNHIFHHSDMSVIGAFQRVSGLHDKLCEFDQKVFQKLFSGMIKQIAV